MNTPRYTMIAGLLCAMVLGGASEASAAVRIEGQVRAGGGVVTGSTVTLWMAANDAPVRLGQARTDADGRFVLSVDQTPGGHGSFYLVAGGGMPAASKEPGENKALVLLSVLGNTPPPSVTVNEFTTIASVLTHNQFIEGTTIKGSALALRIAAGNIPNFVDLQTGGYGATMADGLNSTQTPTLANFSTLANVIAGCATRVKADACASFFAAAKGPAGPTPADTLAAVEAIARYPSHQPASVFALLDEFYPYSKDKPVFRPTPFIPYLTFAPSAWVFPLKFAGGGFAGGGKLMFDSEGNAWAAANFMVGAQNQDNSPWNGTLAKFAPNGKPLSPAITGFTGGGIGGPGFGLTLDAQENVWVASFGSRAISKFDRTGKPLSPSDGWNFDHQLSSMQGIIATPNGDIWAIDTMKAQVVYLPNGDPTKAKFFCQNPTSDPLKNPCNLLAPFHIAIDQQDRIWITNILGEHVTRFPASDPSKVETFKTGWSGSGMAIDSLGNAWITNKLGSSPRGALKQAEMAAAFKFNFENDPDASARTTKALVYAMVEQKSGYEGGSVSVLRPDGSEANFSPIYGKGIAGPWAATVDGNDNVWITNLTTASAGIVELCGFRTENCPPGMKTGDAISPPGGYVGGGLQMQVDAQIGPAGDVWVTNNWQYYQAMFGKVDEALQTLGAGSGVVVFYGMAKPVRTPLMGPPRPAP